VVPLVRTVTVAPAVEYVAAAATVSWSGTANFLQQGLPAASVPVVWTGPALTFSTAQTLTDANGAVRATLTNGPLAAGAQATGSVCGWASVCGTFVAQGVDPAEFAAGVLGGAGQSVAAAGGLAPVTVEITDSLGNPVAGAAVQVHQTVSQWTAPCPVTGRCPVAPVYQASNTAAVSDSGGMVVITPLEIAGPEVTDIVVTAGTQGFVSLSLQKHP
jgi:hypothetical protein